MDTQGSPPDDIACFNCAAPCSTALGNFAPCDVCGLSPLCVACSTTYEVAVCMQCASQQDQAAKKKETERNEMKSCTKCRSVWETKVCYRCDKYWCDDCFKKDPSHLCYRCIRCDTWTEIRCCGHCYCEVCFNEYHVVTDCRMRLSYNCPKCKTTVLQFGNDKYRCGTPNCEWKYACHHCSNVKPILSKDGLPYCQYHISKEICQGCGSRYGLNGLEGKVTILQLLGNGNPHQIYCGNCRQRCRALVQGILLMKKRTGLVIPKVVVDMVLFEFMRRKWYTWMREQGPMRSEFEILQRLNAWK